MIIKCVIACAANGNGEPDLTFVKVECTQKQYEDGDHYQAAEDWAREENESPFVVFDENDPPKPLFELFEWDTAIIINCPYPS